MRFSLRGPGRPALLLLGAALAVALTLAPGSAPTALACTQGPDPQPTDVPVSAFVNLAQLIAIGRVIDLADAPNGMPDATAIVQVSEYLKGGGPPTLVISGFGPDSMCFMSVSQGVEYVFSVVSDGEGEYRGIYLNQLKPAERPSPELIAQIRAAVGDQPTGITPAPGEQPAAPSEQPAAPGEQPAAPGEQPAAPGEQPAARGPWWSLGLVVLAGLVVAGIIGMARARRV